MDYRDELFNRLYNIEEIVAKPNGVMYCRKKYVHYAERYIYDVIFNKRSKEFRIAINDVPKDILIDPFGRNIIMDVIKKFICIVDKYNKMDNRFIFFNEGELFNGKPKED